MRPILAASILLSPMLLVASAVASQPKIDSPIAKQKVQISTGVSTPEMIGSAAIGISETAMDRLFSGNAKFVLSLNVDEKGEAENVRVIKSTDPNLNGRVIAAVSQSHFHPARLDNRAIPVTMELVVDVQR